MQIVNQIASDCIDEAYEKLMLDDKQTIKNLLCNLYFKYNLSLVFNSRSVIELSKGVFSGVVIKEYIDDVTARFGIDSVGVYWNDGASLEKTIAIGIVGDQRPIKEEDYVPLTPEVILQNTESDPQTIYKLLCSNRWLLSIILIMFCFSTTKVMKEVIAAQLQESKK